MGLRVRTNGRVPIGVWLHGLLCVCACGGTLTATSKRVVEPRAAGPLAAHVGLFDTLPTDVERCALLGLEGATAAERALLEHGGSLQSFVWQLGIPMRAVAVVSRRARGARAVAYAIETDVSAQEVATALRGAGRFQVRLGGGPAACMPDDCPVVVSSARTGVVRIDLGLFLGQPLLSESSRDCRGLATQPGSLRLVGSERVMPTMGKAVGPLQVRTEVRADEGVLLSAREVYIDEEAAQQALELLPFHSLLGLPSGSQMGQRSRRREGREVVSTQLLGAEELAWLLRDEAFRRRNQRYGVHLVRLHGAGEGDPARLEREARLLGQLSELRALLLSSGHLTAEHPAVHLAGPLLHAARTRFADVAEVMGAARALEAVLPVGYGAQEEASMDVAAP